MWKDKGWGGESKIVQGSKTYGMTSEGLGEMFKGDFADTCVDKFPLVSMGGQAEGQVFTDPEQGNDHLFSPQFL